MVFSSLAFLFIFLTVHLAVYWLVPDWLKNPVLLASSLVFYAWGGPVFLLILVFESLVSWFLALQVERAQDPRSRKGFLIAECVVLLGMLAYFKYTGFFLSNIQAIFGVPEEIPSVILPIGISFYTFQLISYVVDVYRGQVRAQQAFWKLLLYSSLFHQCIAGPIVRYETVAAEIEQRNPAGRDVNEGVRRFAIGLAKKSILANGCASVADTLVPAGTGALAGQAVTAYWLGMIFYMLQIYLDFSAYSDMAIGLGRMIGFHYLENFDHPYQASSVRDFWRRWHISLSSFFRDYVYIPLGGSRVAPALVVRNTLVVWLLTGFWHGASWNYVLWGLYFFCLLMLERYVIQDRLPKPVGHILALLAVFVSWVLFRFEDFSEMLLVLGSLVGVGTTGFTSLAVHTQFMANIFLLVFSCIACTGFGSWLRRRFTAAARDNELVFRAFSIAEAITPPLLLVVSIIALAGANYNPFIYFQF